MSTVYKDNISDKSKRNQDQNGQQNTAIELVYSGLCLIDRMESSSEIETFVFHMSNRAYA